MKGEAVPLGDGELEGFEEGVDGVLGLVDGDGDVSEVAVGELELMVTVCVLLQSLVSPLKVKTTVIGERACSG